jgi:saxitoxin biosynthesis operon SxtJ-like protein
MAAGFAVIAAARWRAHSSRQVIGILIAVAAAFLLAGLIAPRSLSGIYAVWMRIGEALAWINTRIILTLIFFLVVTPTGLVMRLFGRSPLDPRRRRSAASYWDDVSYRDRHLENQF